MALIATDRKPLPCAYEAIAFSPCTSETATANRSNSDLEIKRFNLQTCIVDARSDRIARHANSSEIMWHANDRLYAVSTLQATGSTIIVYDRALREQRRTPLGRDPRGREPPGRYYMTCDRMGNIVVGITDPACFCLVVLDTECKILETHELPYAGGHNERVMRHNTFAIVCDANDNVLWIDGGETGLRCYNRNTKKMSRVLKRRRYYDIAQKRDGSIIASSTNDVIVYFTEYLDCIATRPLYGIAPSEYHEDHEGCLWGHSYAHVELVRLEEHLQWTPLVHTDARTYKSERVDAAMLAWWKCGRVGGTLTVMPIELMFEVFNAVWYIGLVKLAKHL